MEVVCDVALVVEEVEEELEEVELLEVAVIETSCC
jgi:hypothetical protein